MQLERARIRNFRSLCDVGVVFGIRAATGLNLFDVIILCTETSSRFKDG